MSEFPECLKMRGDEEGEHRNGQVCHRIAYHVPPCLFDRPAEFEPPRYPSNFRTNNSLGRLAQSTVVTPQLVPNPAAET